ncbi:hypothetical protein [Sorangium sp. So ce394]|uniref:hypothetical protein n=1 Tax=Sorangium sp. So ce394 TaxID=3133310 RepID=UPI003F5BC200
MTISPGALASNPEPVPSTGAASLAEDAAGIAPPIHPAAHLVHIERLKVDMWDIENERALPVWLMHRIDRQGDPVPIAQR